MVQRILLKVSGEAFCSKDGFGFDKGELKRIAGNIKDVIDSGIETAVVIGAGNLIRGRDLCSIGVSRSKADNMGMVATIINAVALQDELERQGVDSRVLSAMFLQQVVEPYVIRKCDKHLKKKRAVILAGGTGNPYFTTDSAAALRAAEINADLLLKATKVDGVYSADPMVNSDAERYDRLTYMDVLNKRLNVMDATAITLCMENNIPIVVFSMREDSNIRNIIEGKNIGTYIGRIEDACR